ncbi:DinB family protein [Aridibaculum aurantiacum]|uniref:DinB family protein n=1 Tax=Aridibaculum aurantiacum TaxID=2810307 RepID=UPI001A95C71F|nr:DinB family protein [Aridibaculum aurantiacum]
MPTYKTNELIEQLQQQTENFLQEAISEWQLMPAAVLLQQPAAGKWSAAQCLEHLNSYGRYYLPAIEKAIEASKAKGQNGTKSFSSGWLGNYFTNMMKPTHKMKKMASPKDHAPKADLDAAKVVGDFIDQQERLLLLLEEAQHIDMNKATVAISIAKFIKLKLGDVFMFLVAHNERHIVQAEKALNSKVKNQKAKDARVA